jgi:hypothetical protein
MKDRACCPDIRVWIVAGLSLWLAFEPCLAIEKAQEPTTAEQTESESTPDPVSTTGSERGSATTAEGRSRLPRELVQFGGEIVIGQDEEVEELVVLFGSVRMEGRVRGDMVVVGGSAVIDGAVDGDVVVPLGSLQLGPEAEVGGDLVVVLGEMTADPAASVGGERIEITLSALEEHLPPMEGLRRWVTQGLALGRPLPHQVGWWWWFALACGFLYVLTALVFARPIALSVDALESRPVGSFFLGLLMFLISGPLLLLLIATGVGLLVVPFVLCAAFVAFLFGKIAVYQYLGRQIGRQLSSTFLQVPLVALVVGTALFYVMYMVPVLGLGPPCFT